jgi:hypothetical protein
VRIGIIGFGGAGQAHYEAGRTVLASLAGVESYRTNRPVAVRQIGS